MKRSGLRSRRLSEPRFSERLGTAETYRINDTVGKAEEQKRARKQNTVVFCQVSGKVRSACRLMFYRKMGTGGSYLGQRRIVRPAHGSGNR